MMKWDQRKILDWSTETFGEKSALSIAVRGNKEMSELLSALENGVVSEKEIAMEFADMTVFMMQIAEKMGYDLLFLVDINEERQRRTSMGEESRWLFPACMSPKRSGTNASWNWQSMSLCGAKIHRLRSEQ